MGKRGRPPKGEKRIVFVPEYEMRPFLKEIEECTKDLDFACRMYSIELGTQGYNEKEIEAKVRQAVLDAYHKMMAAHEKWGDLGAG